MVHHFMSRALRDVRALAFGIFAISSSLGTPRAASIRSSWSTVPAEVFSAVYKRPSMRYIMVYQIVVHHLMVRYILWCTI